MSERPQLYAIVRTEGEYDSASMSIVGATDDKTAADQYAASMNETYLRVSAQKHVLFDHMQAWSDKNPRPREKSFRSVPMPTPKTPIPKNKTYTDLYNEAMKKNHRLYMAARAPVTAWEDQFRQEHVAWTTAHLTPEEKTFFEMDNPNWAVYPMPWLKS